MEAASGVEPLNGGFADLSLATWVRRRGETAKKTSPPGLGFGQKTGAGHEIRTRDFNLGKVALYR